MFKSLFRPKATIDSITIPTFGWELQSADASKKLWMNAERTMALTLNYFDQRPDLPSIHDIFALRAFYRNLAVQSNGGIIEVSLTKLEGFDAVKTILKIPQAPNGTTYLASITLPFKDCSFVVKVQANDVDGMRSTLVLDQMMELGTVKLEAGGLKGWTCDPYDPEFREGKLMNLSEAVEYDAGYAGYGLAEARRLIALVEAGIEFGEEIGRLKGFG